MFSLARWGERLEPSEMLGRCIGMLRDCCLHRVIEGVSVDVAEMIHPCAQEKFAEFARVYDKCASSFGGVGDPPLDAGGSSSLIDSSCCAGGQHFETVCSCCAGGQQFVNEKACCAGGQQILAIYS